MSELFSPRSIAVVGALRERHAPGRRILDALASAPFQGQLHAVDDCADRVGAIPCHRSLVDVGSPIDLVVVAVPAEHVLDVVRDAADIRARGAVVISGGFAEAGADGERRQNELAAIAAARGLRIVGPNCLGIATTDPTVNMNASLLPRVPCDGSVALCSQSGADSTVIAERVADSDLGLSSFAGIGNQVDVAVDEVVEWWGTDERTVAGLLHLESVADPWRFRVVASAVGRTTPLAAMWAEPTDAGSATNRGRRTSDAAARAVHARACDALLEQSRLIRAASLDDLLGIGRILMSQPLPCGRRTAVVTNAGGPGVRCVDALRCAGLRVGEFGEESRRALSRALPDVASAANPIELPADTDPETYRRVVEAASSLDEIDVLVVLHAPTDPAIDAAARRSVGEAVVSARGQRLVRPVLMATVADGVQRSGADRDDPGANVPIFDDPEDLARVLGAICDHAERRSVDHGDVVHFEDQDLDVVREIVVDELRSNGEGRVSFAVARRVLRSAGVDVGDEACQAAERLGDALCVGAVRDATFGPLVGVARGRTPFEVPDSAAFRLAPMARCDAAEQVGSLPDRPVGDGGGGAPEVDVEAVIDIVLRVSALLAGVQEIVELDLDPVVAGPDGVVAGGVRMAVRRT